jgi:hypothetical protein
MSFATLNLEAGFPTVDDARRRLLSEMQSARARGVRVIKVIHGCTVEWFAIPVVPVAPRLVNRQPKRRRAAAVHGTPGVGRFV